MGFALRAKRVGVAVWLQSNPKPSKPILISSPSGRSVSESPSGDEAAEAADS